MTKTIAECTGSERLENPLHENLSYYCGKYSQMDLGLLCMSEAASGNATWNSLYYALNNIHEFFAEIEVLYLGLSSSQADQNSEK